MTFFISRGVCALLDRCSIVASGREKLRRLDALEERLAHFERAIGNLIEFLHDYIVAKLASKRVSVAVRLISVGLERWQ